MTAAETWLSVFEARRKRFATLPKCEPRKYHEQMKATVQAVREGRVKLRPPRLRMRPQPRPTSWRLTRARTPRWQGGHGRGRGASAARAGPTDGGGDGDGEGDPPAATAAARKGHRDQRLAAIEKQSGSGESLSTGKRYPVIYADPPWQYQAGTTDSTRRIENQYPTMCLDEIRGLRVCGRSIAELATDTAILYMWAPSPKLAEAMTVVESWGFVYRTCLVWVKPTIGPGYWARQRHEMLLVATRGSMPTPLPPTRPDSVIEAPRGRHSQKPAVVYELIERCWPSLAKVELFARMARDGWDRWGLEAPGSGVVP